MHECTEHATHRAASEKQRASSFQDLAAHLQVLCPREVQFAATMGVLEQEVEHIPKLLALASKPFR
eukprot:12932066-Prorocentrum_lima.AAC.1